MKVSVVLMGGYEIPDDRMMEFYGTDDLDEALEKDRETFEGDPGLLLDTVDLQVVSVERVA